MSIPVIALVLAFVFLIGQIQLMEGYHPFNPLIDTQRSEKYSMEKFDQIAIGDTRAKVDSLIGMPLYSDSADSILWLHYTGDGRLLNTYGERPDRSYGDFAWYRSSLTFDYNNKVIDIDKGWSYD